jgi:hypothetical protein
MNNVVDKAFNKQAIPMKRRRWPVAMHTFESQYRPFAYTIY